MIVFFLVKAYMIVIQFYLWINLLILLLQIEIVTGGGDVCDGNGKDGGGCNGGSDDGGRRECDVGVGGLVVVVVVVAGENVVTAED